MKPETVKRHRKEKIRRVPCERKHCNVQEHPALVPHSPTAQLIWTLVSSQAGMCRPNDVEMIAIVWKGLAQSYHIFVMTGQN